MPPPQTRSRPSSAAARAGQRTSRTAVATTNTAAAAANAEQKRQAAPAWDDSTTDSAAKARATGQLSARAGAPWAAYETTSHRRTNSGIGRSGHADVNNPSAPRDAPLRVAELASSTNEHRNAGGSSSNGAYSWQTFRGDEAGIPPQHPQQQQRHAQQQQQQAVEQCACSDYHSLRCCPKLFSMLHRSVELDAAAAARESRRRATEQARARAEAAELRALFGDLPNDAAAASAAPVMETPDEWAVSLPAASLRLHNSDFTLGNLKNQATRLVLPPSVIFSRPAPARPSAATTAAAAAASDPFAPRSSVELYFTSLQSGEILRKSRSKVSPTSVLEELLRFARTNMGQALAALSQHAAEAARAANRASKGTREPPDDRAWALEKEYTEQLQFGSSPSSSFSSPFSAAVGGSGGTKSNLPNYMRATKRPSTKSPLALSAAAVAAATARPASAASSRPPGPFAPGSDWARSADQRAAAQQHMQHPLSSAPSTPPAQHCDILAQFTFASDAPRFNDPNLPHTLLTPAQVAASTGSDGGANSFSLAGFDAHAHPDILYLSARSLHHFLTVVNNDFARPRALGVLQPFVIPRAECNTVYRACFTALPSSNADENTKGAARLRSAALLDPSSALPACFHISVEGRANMLKLRDHTGLAAAAAAAAIVGRPTTAGGMKSAQQQFSLSERAVTWDASHLSLQLDASRSTKAAAAAATSTAREEHLRPSKMHVLYPRMPSEFGGGPPPPSNLQPQQQQSTTLVVPSGYPFSPSAATAAARLRVPVALQERLQACMLRMVAHINELHRAARNSQQNQAAAKQAQMAALQRELYGASVPLAGDSGPTASRAPAVSVGYLEATFKIDSSNNLFLITARCIKQLVVNGDSPSTSSSASDEPVMVRCAQCLRPCSPPAEVAALSHPLSGQIGGPVLRPTSAVLQGQQSPAALAAAAAQQAKADAEREVPFYARHRAYRDDAELDEAENARCRRHATAAAGASGQPNGAIVYGGAARRRRGDDGDGADQDDDPSLWPESHFNPPPPPASRFSAVSERVQSNPLFDAAPPTAVDGHVHIRDEEDGGHDGGTEDVEAAPVQPRRVWGNRTQQPRIQEDEKRHRLDRLEQPTQQQQQQQPQSLDDNDEMDRLERAMQQLKPVDLHGAAGAATAESSSPSFLPPRPPKRPASATPATAGTSRSANNGPNASAAATAVVAASASSRPSSAAPARRASLKQATVGANADDGAARSHSRRGNKGGGSMAASSSLPAGLRAPGLPPSASASRSASAASLAAAEQLASQWHEGGSRRRSIDLLEARAISAAAQRALALRPAEPAAAGPIRVYDVFGLAATPEERARMNALYPQLAAHDQDEVLEQRRRQRRQSRSGPSSAAAAAPAVTITAAQACVAPSVLASSSRASLGDGLDDLNGLDFSVEIEGNGE